MSQQAPDTTEDVTEQIRTHMATISEETAELQAVLEECENPALERNAAQLERLVTVLETNLPPR